jgi:hypothetical protein
MQMPHCGIDAAGLGNTREGQQTPKVHRRNK